MHKGERQYPYSLNTNRISLQQRMYILFVLAISYYTHLGENPAPSHIRTHHSITDNRLYCLWLHALNVQSLQ